MKCEMDLRSRELSRECRFLKPRMLTASVLCLTLALLIFLPALLEVYAEFLRKENAATNKAIEVISQKTAHLEILVEETALLEREYALARRFENETKSIHALLSLILSQAESNNQVIKEITVTEDNNLIIAAYTASIMEAARFNQALAQHPTVNSTQVTGLELREDKYSFAIKSAFSSEASTIPVKDNTTGGFGCE